MSLQVWLPLNGNLNNQGLDPLNSLSASSVTFAEGKLGKCLNNNGIKTTSGIFTSLLGAKQYTVAAWIKINTVNTSSNYVDIISLRAQYDDSSYSLFRIEHTSTNGAYQIIHGKSANYGSNTNAYHNLGTSTTAAKDKWCHICVTNDEISTKYYLDGVLTKTTTNSAVYGNHFLTGEVILGNTGSYSMISDLRIYDNAISPKEVQLLSQGLLAHYPLRDPCLEKTTNLLSNGRFDGFSSLTVPVSSITYNSNNIGTLTTGNSNNTTGSLRGNIDLSKLTNATAYAISFKWKLISGSGTLVPGDWCDRSLTIKKNSFNGYYNEIEILTSAREVYDSTYHFLDFNNVAPNSVYEIWDVQLEKKDHCTPFTLNSRTNTTCYDYSGFHNDGTVGGNLQIINSSARNDKSAKFSGTEYINIGRNPMVTDEITISLWTHMNDWSQFSNSIRLMSCTEGGGWNFENVGHFICYANGAYQRASGNFSTAAAGWHMITGTWDGYQAKVYFDGVLQASSTKLSAKYPITYNASNVIFIGAEPNSSAITPGGPYFTGQISDVRIYGTALSDNDILELYNTPIVIDNNQNLIANEFKEVE